MIDVKNKSDCCGCGACETICPKKCLTLCKDEYGFCYPKIEKEACINCDACKKVCPILNMPIKSCSEKRMYAGSNNNLDSKMHSSSGGIFSLLANIVLQNEGVVFGVKLSDDCRFSLFTQIRSSDELIQIMGSKYVQARPEYVYRKVKEELNGDYPVLFSGTPCHVAALTNYLNRKYDNLYLVDLSCHGVPSEKAWNRYLDCREAETGAKVISASFRSKESGWKDFSVATDFSNGSHHSEIFIKDSYGKAFTQRLLFRPSCEHCKFKGLNRYSDITLADFWGIDEITDSFKDEQGTSLVITHTEKGANLIDIIKEKDLAKIVPVSQEQGTRRNPYLFRSVVPHSNKKKFFAAIDKMDFDELVEQYANEEFVLKDFLFDLKRYVKRKLGKK